MCVHGTISSSHALTSLFWADDMALRTAATSPFSYMRFSTGNEGQRSDFGPGKERRVRLTFSSTSSTAKYCACDLSPSPPE